MLPIGAQHAAPLQRNHAAKRRWRARRAERKRWYSKKAESATSTTTTTVVASGWAVAIHVSHTAKTSSPILKNQLLKGSGLALTAARALAFVPCAVRAIPPASKAAPPRHSGAAPPAAA